LGLTQNRGYITQQPKPNFTEIHSVVSDTKHGQIKEWMYWTTPLHINFRCFMRRQNTMMLLTMRVMFSVRFNVLMVVSTNMAASIITALMMEAVWTSETKVNLYQSTWHYKPEDSYLQLSMCYYVTPCLYDHA
jgi:hypothetical protein